MTEIIKLIRREKHAYLGYTIDHDQEGLEELESIALEVRDEIRNDESILCRDRSSLAGACVSAADIVIEKLRDAGVEDVKKAWIELLDDRYSKRRHTLVFLGPTFEDSYRIDPTISMFGIYTYVFEPQEPYPLNHRVTSQYSV